MTIEDRIHLNHYTLEFIREFGAAALLRQLVEFCRSKEIYADDIDDATKWTLERMYLEKVASGRLL